MRKSNLHFLKFYTWDLDRRLRKITKFKKFIKIIVVLKVDPKNNLTFPEKNGIFLVCKNQKLKKLKLSRRAFNFVATKLF